ncbi:MAG: hypothetical protein A4S12_07015 [Proteobacteria bacterium SG_bin5]|nr:MAG: hypothetical protein A4S12_07015 [Proteobacteria bacterium SG_bin5]
MKISGLPLVGRLLDGTERLPIVQDGVTRGLSLAMLLNSVAALLPAAFRGPPGGSNNTYARREDVAIAEVPEGTDLIWLADEAEPWIYDPEIDADAVDADPESSVLDANGRGFTRRNRLRDALASDQGGANVGLQAPGAGSIKRWLSEKLGRDLKTVRDKGAVGDRWTDDLPAFQAAIADAATNDQYPAPLIVPAGHYHRTAALGLPGHAFLRGDGPSSVLNSQNKNLQAPILTNADPYGWVGGVLKDLQLFGGTHGVKLNAASENANLTLWGVSMALQTKANIEANKLLQTTYLFGGTLSAAPYGIRVNDWTTNLLMTVGTQFTDHAVSSLRLRTCQGVALIAPRFEGRGAVARLRVFDATIANGQQRLTSATGAFTAAHKGRGIVVQRANGIGEPFRTAIADVISPTQVDLLDPAPAAFNNVIADIDGPFGATIDVEDVNGSFLVQSGYFEKTQEYVLRARRAKNILFDSCHFTGQTAGYSPAIADGFQPYRWDVDDSVITLRNCHANFPTATPPHVRLEGENVNFYPSYAQYFGNDYCGGVAAKSFDINSNVFNIITIQSIQTPGPRNFRALFGTLALRYVGYNANGTIFRMYSAIYDVKILAGRGTSANKLIITFTEQAARRDDGLGGGTITLAYDSTAENAVIAVSFGGNFDMAAEDGHLGWEMRWKSVENLAADVIRVRAA